MHHWLVGEHGYYSRRKAEIGDEGDFATCPQRTELFGAGIGMMTMKVWEAMGRPLSFDVVEIGAGQGEMAKGLLKWAQNHQKAFYDATKYKIIEVGSLILKQRETLEQYEGKIEWI